MKREAERGRERGRERLTPHEGRTIAMMNVDVNVKDALEPAAEMGERKYDVVDITKAISFVPLRMVTSTAPVDSH